MQPDHSGPESEPEAGPDPVDPQAPECGFAEVSCHVTGWFADFVADALNPLFGWIAGMAFRVPQPSQGVEGLWEGVLAVTNTCFVLFVVAGGVVVMGRETFQTRYSAGEVAGRVVFAFVAANFSLWVARELFRAADALAESIGALGIDAEEAALNLRGRMEEILTEVVVFTVLLLVALVVMLVVWVITDVVRVVMSIVLVIAAPLLLAFHALPQTNYIAVLWWRTMAGLCAMPVLQSLAFIAMMRLFFEGQFAYFGHLDTAAGGVLGGGTGLRPLVVAAAVPADEPTGGQGGAGILYDLVLFLVLVYVQVRIPFWVMKLVWSPHPGRSPIVALAKVAAMMLFYRGLRHLRLAKGEPFTYHRVRSGPAPLRMLTGRRPGMLTAGDAGSTPPGPGGLEPLRPNAWWVRRSYGSTAGELPGFPASGSPWGATGPRPVGGPRALGPIPPPRPGWSPSPRAAVGDGRFPRRPRTEQEVLFRPPPVPKTPPRRRWRQGVLPTPPPVRVTGRRAVQRLGEVLDAPAPQRPVRVRGQLGLFPAPRRHWVQRRLPMTTVHTTIGKADRDD
ncbi:hypothetical protein HNR12_004526 [Streptomonospora nanhaiensis]|uniref:TrbL/VirB6 plasmid conjugal transfer protein n=1 Tax=Streptomonospora nanhaiensis TaxID=1323731 RepID=A0A853BR91_9ACTN|nr:hypothetical protein [Streptomonospora nanhaiensis]NYI98249.1 hypothetical protein [Streptomonospora nanhaiensis]